jgi:phasin
MNVMAEHVAFKTNAEKGAAQIENTFASAARGIKDYNLKALEFAQLESDVAFDYAKQLMSAKSPSEMLELWTMCVRKEFELLTEETKELAMLGQRAASETAEPLSKRSH